MKTILHSSSTMRLATCLSILAATILAALGQTNTAPVVRQLSLEDCLEMALRENLDIQVERYNPQIARFDWRASYGYYDPTLSFSGQHEHNDSLSSFNTNFFIGTNLVFNTNGVTRRTSDQNSFDSGLTGYLPWGMRYDLAGNASDSDGFSSGFGSSGSAHGKLTQPLLKNFWIDTGRLTIKVNKNLLNRSELVLKQRIVEQITLVEQAYFDLIFYRENVEVKRKAVELAEQLVVENRKRVEVGAMAPLDAKQAESQAATTRAELITARSLLAVQENMVKKLMAATYSDWQGTTLEPTAKLGAPSQSFDLQTSWRKGLTQRPEILQSKLDAERAGIYLKYDRNQLFPQLDLFATYGYNGSGNEFSGTLYDIQERNRPFYIFGGQISIPLANLSARNNYKSSKVTLQQATLTVKRWERDIMKAVDDDIKLAQAGFEGVSATRIAREYAEDALAAEQKKLEQGKSTTYTVLQMQRDLTTARGAEIKALDEYNKYLSQLSLDEGTTFERLGIDYDLSYKFEPLVNAGLR